MNYLHSIAQNLLEMELKGKYLLYYNGSNVSISSVLDILPMNLNGSALTMVTILLLNGVHLLLYTDY